MPQTFDPNNVTLLQKRDGSIPEKHAILTIQEIMQNSKVMQLGKYEAMDGLEKKFDVFVKGGGAYWVDETQRSQQPRANGRQSKCELRSWLLSCLYLMSTLSGA